MADRVTDEDLELLDELGVDTAPAETGGRTAREQRIIAGFEEIERFYDEQGRAPQHGENRDIFERLYAVRLDRLRASAECREVLKGLDSRGLLEGTNQDGGGAPNEPATDEDLLAALGVDSTPTDDVRKLVHVRPHVERKAAEEVAQRMPCADFETFRPVFEKVQKELAAGVRSTAPFQHNGKLEPGDMFILGGQKVLVAGADEIMEKDFGREDRRLRVIFDNGTESNLWLRSLQRALYKDQRNRRILPPDATAAPLFADRIDDDDSEVGFIYVLRSRSDHPFVAQHRDLIHKIGVTSGDVKSRITNAKKDPTYLLADVEVIAEYKLANVNRKALEALLHKFFAGARLDLELKDRFGSQVEPREWFLVPLAAIDEAIQKIKDGTIGGFWYDPEQARLTLGSGNSSRAVTTHTS
jgi:hypothetical protein